MEILGNVIVALIAGGLSLVGVIITNNSSNKKVEQQLMTAQAVTDNKIENLTTEVRKHNDFGMKIPVLESEVSQLKQEIRELKEKIA